MSARHAEFHDRLARIQSGAGFTKATVYVGLDQAFSYTPPNRRRNNGLGDVIANAGYALSFPFCMMMGFLAHGFERYASYVLSGMPDPQANIDVEMVKIAVTGSAIALVATYLMGLRDHRLLVAKLLGVAIGMLFFHNAVHLWPHVFEAAFSPRWVAQVTSHTEYSSIYWRGITFPF